MTVQLKKCQERITTAGSEENKKNLETVQTYMEEVDMITKDF